MAEPDGANLPAIDVDYLVIGAGAVGMAFVDTLLTETSATIAIVDRQHRPGGHWNDAYPFVRLHQPAAHYGVNSRELGSNRIDTHGLNKGFYELASGAEIVSYFDAVMRERFLPSGRVQYFPMSDYHGGQITSSLSGRTRAARGRKIVNATWSSTSVPSCRPPQYGVAPGVTCIPPNALPQAVRPSAEYVIVGAGKTAIDTCCWLLENGADPTSIRWIMPRDSWLLDRANFQPGQSSLASTMRSAVGELDALAAARSVPEVFAGLESRRLWRRIDPTITPTAFHCAIVSDGELAQLRRIEGIVRLGRVKQIEPDSIVLVGGTIPTGKDVVHIDCSAPGVPPGDLKPIFEDRHITLQWVRLCQPVFSGAFIAHVEATYTDEAGKNHLCAPIPRPQVPVDWLRMMAVELANRRNWSMDETLDDWRAASRLDGITARLRHIDTTDAELMTNLQRYGTIAGLAVKNLRKLLESADSASSA